MAVDVSDPTDPIGLKSFGMPMNGRDAWHLDSKGNSIILTYINALVLFVSTESGLRRINWHITTDVIDVGDDQIEMKVYPSPAAKELFIAVNQPLEIETIYLHHILGLSHQLDISVNQSKGPLHFDIGSFRPGMYYLRAQMISGELVTIPVVIH